MIGINGFGRIGRLALRSALLYYPEASVLAVNTSDSMTFEHWIQLFKYDSVYGKFPHEITLAESTENGTIGTLSTAGKTITFTSFRDPSQIPWSKLGVKTVMESTGVFLKKEDAQKHIDAGAVKVVMSAPAKDDTPYVLLGINSEMYKNEPIISNCSCTTYSVTPVMKLITEHFSVVKATMTTIHAYTADQVLVDGSHKKDIRRARAAAQNIIPTSSGAAKAVTRVLPQLKDKFEATAIRVPVPAGSLSDMTIIMEQPTSVEEINAMLTEQSAVEFPGIVTVTTDPVVSSDIIGNSHSAIIDLSMTQVLDGTMVKIFSWYDNEWSYACRLVELARAVSM